MLWTYSSCNFLLLDYSSIVLSFLLSNSMKLFIYILNIYFFYLVSNKNSLCDINNFPLERTWIKKKSNILTGFTQTNIRYNPFISLYIEPVIVRPSKKIWYNSLPFFIKNFQTSDVLFVILPNRCSRCFHWIQSLLEVTRHIIVINNSIIMTRVLIIYFVTNFQRMRS